MSDSEGSSSGNSTEEFSIEELERMASGEESTASAKKKKTSTKRKAAVLPKADSDDEDSDDTEAKPKSKKACFEVAATVKPKPSPKKRPPPKTMAIDPDGKERPLPKTTQVMKAPSQPLTYKEFLRKIEGGNLTEDEAAAICEGITIFKQRTAQQPKLLWGFKETIFPMQRYTLFVKKPDVTKVVQQLYNAMDPKLSLVPFDEFEPQVTNAMNPEKAPRPLATAFERAVLKGTGYGLPAASFGKRRAPPVAGPAVPVLAESVKKPVPVPAAMSSDISLQKLADFAATSKARITIQFGN